MAISNDAYTTSNKYEVVVEEFKQAMGTWQSQLDLVAKVEIEPNAASKRIYAETPVADIPTWKLATLTLWTMATAAQLQSFRRRTRLPGLIKITTSQGLWPEVHSTLAGNRSEAGKMRLTSRLNWTGGR